MGIKFLCPNGHKLHVKAFLGGKRAICPKCGARVVVPPESESAGGSAQEPSDERHAAASAHDSSRAEAMTATSVPATSAALAETRPVAPPKTTDPFDEAPGAVWYVRPAMGGQFGPAPAEIMRAWLAEGRVGANSLVWRAPWPEWRSAVSTFVGLSLPAEPPQAKSMASPEAPPVGYAVATTRPTATPEAIPPAAPTMAPLVQAMRKQRKRVDRTLLASGLLAGRQSL